MILNLKPGAVVYINENLTTLKPLKITQFKEAILKIKNKSDPKTGAESQEPKWLLK